MSSYAGFQDKANFVIAYEVIAAIPFTDFVIIFLVQTIRKFKAPQTLFWRCITLIMHCLLHHQNYTRTRTTIEDDQVIQQTVVGISASDPHYGSINQLPSIT